MSKILSSNAQQIGKSRYFMEGENWDKCSLRVVSEIASIESDKSYKDKFYDMVSNMDFLPGGRILRNAGRIKGSLFNCYCLPVEDNIESIGQFIKDSLILWSEGGGIGSDWSFLRPKGDPILKKGGNSSGMVSFLEAADSVARTIETGGQRRAAGLVCVSVSHPEVLDFIDAKIEQGKISHFNISVIINDEFLTAVSSDAPWTFHFKQKEYGTVPARSIWKKIICNMIKYAEPGLINWSNFSKNNSYYYAPVSSPNACIIGDTLVAVADGRNAISIKQLADEEKDVPVFCLNKNTQKVEIKMMRHPRITGYNKKILKINLDDGSFIKCTENHKFYMKDGSIKEAKNLVVNDKLHHMVRFHANFEEIIKNSNSHSQDYIWINNGFRSTIAEHRIMAEFKEKRILKEHEIVHHIDYNGLNNNPKNLLIMIKKDHDKLHCKNMFGDSNPVRRFPEKCWFKIKDNGGKNNGRYMGYTPEEIFDKAVTYSRFLGRRITLKEWFKYCEDNNLPKSRYSASLHKRSLHSMLKNAAVEGDIFVYKYSAAAKAYKRYIKLLQSDIDLDIFFNNGIKVRKKCEHCQNEFITPWELREICFCSVQCSNSHDKDIRHDSVMKTIIKKQQNTRNKQIEIFTNLKEILGRIPLKKEWEKECKTNGISHRIRASNEKNFNEYCFTSYKEINHTASLNYKIVSIEEDGYSNVFNGTVDNNHNFYMMVKESKTKSGKNKYNYILGKQCGEATLSPYEPCNLGSLVLPNFITGNVNTNWNKLDKIIKLAVRFLDNVIDINKYALKETDVIAHNSRRIGIGVMGLSEYLFSKELKYGSPKSIIEIEKLMRFIRESVYTASMELSIEKGSFPKFDAISYGNASFIRKLPAKLRMDIKKYGVRNVTLMALAPTGTISLLPEVSSGIEPLPAKAYKRNDNVNERVYINPKFKELLLEGSDIPEWFVDAGDLKPDEHLEVQAIAQKYTDGSISKTIGMPKGSTYEQLDKILLEYIHDLKGVAVYVDGSREGQVVNRMSKEETLKYLQTEKNHSEELIEEDLMCPIEGCSKE